jgi:hypothetical protein
MADTSSGSASTGVTATGTGGAEGAWSASSSTTAVSIFSSPGSGVLTGGAGAFGGSPFGVGGANTGRCGATVAGVMKRGLGGSAAGGVDATGGGSTRCATGVAALVTTARSEVAGTFAASDGRMGGAEGRKEAGRCSFCSMIAFSASPGLEILDKSILGRSSSELARWRASPRPEPCCSRTYLRTRSASSSSMELE